MKSKPGAPAEAQAQPRPNGQEGDEEETPDETVNTGGETEQVQPSPVPQQPPPPPEAQATPQAKTPEQLLQELQEMRRQKNSPEGDANTPPAPQNSPRINFFSLATCKARFRFPRSTADRKLFV